MSRPGLRPGLLLSIAALWTADASAKGPTPAPGSGDLGLAGVFVENRGQWEDGSRYRAQVSTGLVHFSDRGLLLHVVRRPGTSARTEETDRMAATVRLSFDRARDDLLVRAARPVAGTRTYVRGRDPARWRTGVRAFQELRYDGVLPGVDVRFHILDGALKYDLLLAPGADLPGLQLRCEGVERLELDPAGGLRLHTAAGVLAQPAPRTWLQRGEERVPVACRFRRCGADRFGWEAPDWDGALPLVIDPALVAGTYLGSTANDLVFAMERARNGDLVLAGESAGTDFPTTPGAYQGSAVGTDGFLARLDPGGTTLVHATYYGGSGKDSIMGLDLGANDVATFCGWTDSTDFPVTANVIRPSFSGGSSDAFVARMAMVDGSTPQMSTYLGAAQDEVALECLAVPGVGVYVGGITSSTSFPLAPQPYDATYNGGVDCFLTLLPNNGRRILGGTYLGGSGADGYFNAYYIPLRLDHDGSALIVASQTGSADFPTTPGSWQDTISGGRDAFVTRMDPSLSSLQASTFLGGGGGERLYALTRTASGDLVVAGSTGSVDFPVTPNAYDPSYNGVPGFFLEGYVSRLTPALDQLVYSTFLGGKTHDLVRDLKEEARGTLVLVGTTDSPDFPVTPGAYDGSKGGPGSGIAGQDGFLARLDLTQGTAGLVYSTFLGGSSMEQLKCVELGATEGTYHLAGDTVSNDFPVTANAFDPTYNQSQDVFFATLQLAAWLPFGAGLPGTLGVPDLRLDADPVQGSSINVQVENSRGVPTLAMAFLGVAPNPNSGLGPGELHVDPLLWPRLSLRVGLNSFPWAVPTDPALTGQDVYLQVLQGDPGAVGGVAFTPGLWMVLGG